MANSLKKPKLKVRVVADIVQTLPTEEEAKLVHIIERFETRVIGIRRIVIQEFFALAKRPSKQEGFTDIKLLNGDTRTIATAFLRFKVLASASK